VEYVVTAAHGGGPTFITQQVGGKELETINTTVIPRDSRAQAVGLRTVPHSRANPIATTQELEHAPTADKSCTARDENRLDHAKSPSQAIARKSTGVYIIVPQ
jgi:hypothetical protein